MSARFPAMIGIIKNSIKTGVKTCSVPANSLCICFLGLLREHGLIEGYMNQYTTFRVRQGFYRGYPRVTILFKYIDSKSTVLRDIKCFKNTNSNFILASKHLNTRFHLNNHKLYLLSNRNGLQLLSYVGVIQAKTHSYKLLLHSRLLAEITV